MKKLDDAVKRFGTPDYGKTAKRLRDFEAQLSRDIGMITVVGLDAPCAASEVEGCEVEGLTLGQRCMVNAFQLDEMNKLPFNGDYDPKDLTIAQQRGTIGALNELLNKRDEEIGRLRRSRHAQARDLWVAAGLVALVLLGAYFGRM